jgi:hypothetical protein
MNGKKSNQNTLPFVNDFLLYQTENGKVRFEVFVIRVCADVTRQLAIMFLKVWINSAVASAARTSQKPRRTTDRRSGEVMKKKTVPENSQFLVYQAEDGQIKIDVRLEEETVWLTQQQMADLFQTAKQNISLHIQNIYEEGELVPEATVKKYLTVRSELFETHTW